MIRALGALSLVGLAPGCVADAPEAAAVSSAAPSARLVLDEADGSGVLSYDDETASARLHWSGDLNNDGLVDRIVYLPEYTGSHGHSYFVVCVGHRGAECSVVWGPAYAQQLTVSERRDDQGWLQLVWEDADPMAPQVAAQKRQLIFNGKKYAFDDS